MTASTSEQLAKLMSGTDLLMLDFDGPVCSVFAGLAAPVVAERLRRLFGRLGVGVSAELEADHDPLSIYRRSINYGPTLTASIYEELVRAEIEAVATAQPTPGASDVIETARDSGRRLAVVSNNAAAAVEAYLSGHGLMASIDHIAARRSPDPELMKPSPAYIVEAAGSVAVPTQRCTLIGDSVTDIEAARNAGSISVGYANKAGKADRLRAAGANAIIRSMDELVPALRGA